MGHLEIINKNAGDYLFILARVVIGIMFFMHGWMKITNPNIPSFMMFVGVLELLIGLGIALGMFARLAAAGGIIIMVSAYIKAHLGINPLESGGELAVAYLCFFLLVLLYGARKGSLEKALFTREFF